MPTPNACQCETPLAMSHPAGLCGYCGHPLRGTAETFDVTQTPGVHQLPATTTNLTPDQFRQWLNTPGRLFIVYLPGRKSFVIKVPEEQHPFFVDLLKQLRLTLGPEVQAQAATPLPDPTDNPEPRPAQQVDQ